MNLCGGITMIKTGSIRFTNTNRLTEDLVEHILKEKISFAIPIQRGYVWDRNKKSLFILNMIEGGPTFPIYVNKRDGVDYVIDGQQRLRTASSFIENKFALSKMPVIESSEGTINISGKKFDDLPSDIKDLILRYTFEYNFGINLTDEQVKTVFIRLNSGKPLSTTEMTKAQIKSVNEVITLAKHGVFKKIMSEKEMEASKNVSLVMQIYVALFEPYKCLRFTAIKKSLNEIQVSQKEQQRIKQCLDIFEKIYAKICEEKSDITNKLIVVFRRKSHFIAFIYTIDQAIQMGISDVDTFTLWVKHFFASEIDKTTISDEYNAHLKDSMNSDEYVKIRFNAMNEDFKQFVNANKCDQ